MVLKEIPPLLIPLAIRSTLPSLPIEDAATPPSCLNTILGLSSSLLLSVSASIINSQSPDVPDEICNVADGIKLPPPPIATSPLK